MDAESLMGKRYAAAMYSYFISRVGYKVFSSAIRFASAKSSTTVCRLGFSGGAAKMASIQSYGIAGQAYKPKRADGCYP